MHEYKIGKLNGKFVVTWWTDGKRRRYRLDADTLGDAKREAIDVIREKTAKPAVLTVKDLWEAYCAEKKAKPVIITMGYNWKALEPHFGYLRPDQITPDTSKTYIAARLATKRRSVRKDGAPQEKSISPGTVWTELGHLRTVLVWATERKMIAYAPPIERPNKPAPKERYLSRSECERLITAATAHHIRLAIILLLSTAARVGAILDLTWDRVDFERGQIRLRRDDMVTRKGRATVPINAGLRAALAAAKEAALTDYVIEWAGSPVASIKTGFAAAVKAAGLKSVTPHVLRHTAAVHLAEAGMSMSEIANYLGHEDSAITEKVYARFSPEHLRESANVLDFTTIRQVR